MYEAFRLIKKFENAKKKGSAHLLECLFSENEKSLVSGKIDKCLTEGKAGKTKTQIDAIPEIRKYVQGGGPLYITGNTEIKAILKHHIGQPIQTAIDILKRHKFAKQYEKGIINFYLEDINKLGKPVYYLVGVDVRSKEIKSVFKISKTAYETAKMSCIK